MNLTKQPVRPKGGFAHEKRKDKTPRDPKQRQPRVLDENYKGLIARLPSIISGMGPCEVCHVRYADATHQKRNTGMQEKPSDMWCLPLTTEEHRVGTNAQHNANERQWWADQGIDPLQACKDLHAVATCPDYDESRRRDVMVGIIASHRMLGLVRRETREDTDGQPS